MIIFKVDKTSAQQFVLLGHFQSDKKGFFQKKNDLKMIVRTLENFIADEDQIIVFFFLFHPTLNFFQGQILKVR